MQLKENECKVYYKGKERFLPFEKELTQLFKDNGFTCWASGFDMCDGVRDLCFRKKEDKLYEAGMERISSKNLRRPISVKG